MFFFECELALAALPVNFTKMDDFRKRQLFREVSLSNHFSTVLNW
jgi:hypothetical protein